MYQAFTPNNHSISSSPFNPALIKKLYDYFQQSYDSRIFDLFIAPRGGDAEHTPDAATYLLCDRLLKELKNSPHRSHLLLGDSGLGKTTLSLWLTREIWKDLNTYRRIPLYIHLPQIDKTKLDTRLLEDYLQLAGLSEEERQSLRRQPLLLILDGHDEIGLRSNQNLFKSNHWDRDDIKVVHCCRQEVLRDLSLASLFEAPAAGTAAPHFVSYYLQLFTPLQIKAYLHQFSEHLPAPLAVELAGTVWSQSGDHYWEWLEKIPSLKELAENPFLLSLVAQTLPTLVEGNPEKSQVLQQHYTRNKIFAVFVARWFRYQAIRLQQANNLLELTREELQGYLKAYAENLAATLLNADGKLILELFEDKQTLRPELAEPLDSQLLVHYESKGKRIFEKRENLQALRAGCLLRTQQEKFRFLHKYLIEYLAAQQLFTGLNGEFEAYQHALLYTNQMKLNQQNLNEIKVIQFLAEHVKSDEQFKKLLGDIILSSKDTPGLAAAAANAITILNAAGINFSHQDFRDIQIPGADLSGSLCYQTDFRGANLKGVRFSQAFLRWAQLEGADITDVHFKELPFITTPSGVKTIAFYQDDQTPQPATHLLVGCYNGSIYQYQPETSQVVVREYKHGLINKNIPLSIAVHSGKSYLVSTGMGSRAHLWSLKTGNCLKELQSHKSSIYSIAFHPEGQYLALGNDDTSISLWYVNIDYAPVSLVGHKEIVWSLAFHPNEQYLASGSSDGICLWDMATRGMLRRLQANPVTSITFHPQGKYLASGSFKSGQESPIGLWDLTTGRLQQSLQRYSGRVDCVSFHPDGNRIATDSYDGIVPLWDVTTGQLQQTLQGHTNNVTCVAFHPNGMHLVSGSEDETIRLWYVATVQSLQAPQVPMENAFLSLAFDTSGKLLASGSEDKTVCLWDVATGQLKQTLQRCQRDVWRLSFHPKGNYLVSGGWDRTIRLWNVTTGQLEQALFDHKSDIMSVAFNRSGDRLASASRDGAIILWEVNMSTGRLNQLLNWHTAEVTSLAFHPDGKRLASGSHDKTVRLWDVTKGQLLKELNGHTYRVMCVVFHYAGKLLASGGGLNDNTIRLWDISSGQYGQLPKTLGGHKSSVLHLEFQPDSSNLASCGSDNTVCFWDVATGACLLRFTLWYETRTLTFSSSSLLSVAGINGHLTVWKLSSNNSLDLQLQWSARPCAQLFLEGANLTQAIGLSDRNQQLCVQRNAKGRPAPVSQRYQAWCSLFQPLIGTGSTTSSLSLMSTPHQRLRVTESIWVVSVTRKTTGNGQHVFLIIEGVRNHRRFIIRAELTSPDSRAVTIELTPLDDFQKFQASVKQYEANQWNITAEEGIALLKNIRTDQQTCLAYAATGNRSVFTAFFKASQGKEFHNCVSWCEKQLGFIGIHFPHRWYHLIVLLPGDLTSPSEHSLVPPVSKV